MLKILEIIALLKKHYPEAKTALNHANPLELLIAAILSAQCTDERVNIVTKNLFKKYKTPLDYLKISLKELEEDIHSTGFYHNKAKNIQGAMRVILEQFKGKVPDNMGELLLLPGVARKTANVVLGIAFKKAEGIVVDTHVSRISKRLGLSKNKNPLKIEEDLRKIIPESKWISFSLELISHGRKICKARNPLCKECFLNYLCPKII